MLKEQLCRTCCVLCDLQGHYICLTVRCFNVSLTIVNINGFNSKSQNDHVLNSLEEKLIN